MPNYRVKPGYRHGDRKQYGPGDVVEMSEFEAATLLDKLELIGDEMPKADRTKELLKDLDSDAKATLFGPDLSKMKIDDILARIDSGQLPAEVALKAEESGKARSTLIDAIKERLGEGAE